MKHSINSREEAMIAKKHGFTYQWIEPNGTPCPALKSLGIVLRSSSLDWKLWFEEGWKLYIIGGTNHDLIEYVKEVMEKE